MEQRIGTVGFGYPEWAGAFYPTGTRPPEFLAYYARCFDALELDTTFHAIPEPERIAKWAGTAPDDFRFAVKCPRLITHAERVGQTKPLMAQLLESLRPMKSKLEYVLLQFPATFLAAQWRQLDALVSAVPTDVPLAAEFRHDSWRASDMGSFLRDHQISWVNADLVGQPREFRMTTDTTYVRFLGEHDRYPTITHEVRDPTDDLLWWTARLAQAKPRKAWVMFNNDFAGHAPATAARWAKLHGLPVSRPPMSRPGLFG